MLRARGLVLGCAKLPNNLGRSEYVPEFAVPLDCHAECVEWFRHLGSFMGMIEKKNESFVGEGNIVGTPHQVEVCYTIDQHLCCFIRNCFFPEDSFSLYFVCETRQRRTLVLDIVYSLLVLLCT